MDETFHTTLRRLCKDEAAFEAATHLFETELVRCHTQCAPAAEFEQTLDALHSHVFRVRKSHTGEYVVTLSKGRLAQAFNIDFPPRSAVPLSKIFPESLLDQIIPYYERAFSGEVVEFETNFHEHWFKTRLMPFESDAQGIVREIIGISDDITAEKLARLDFLQTSSLLNEVWQHALEAFVITAANGTVIDANPAYSELYGVPREELIGNDFAIVFHPDYREQARAAYRAFFDAGQPAFGICAEVVLLNGEKRLMQSSASFIEPLAGKKFLLNIIRDITESTRTKEALLESQTYLSTLFNESSDAILIVDAETLLIADCNPHAVELFEVDSKEDLIGTNSERFQAQPFTLDEKINIWNRLNLGYSWSSELEYVSAKGRRFWGNLSIKELFFGERRVLMLRLADVTHLKEAEQAIQKSEEKLQWLLNALPIGIALREHNKLVFANKAFCQNRGLTHSIAYLQAIQQFSDNPNFQLVHPDDKKAFREHLAKHHERLDRGETISFEHRLRQYGETQYRWYQGFFFKGTAPDGKSTFVEIDIPIEDRKQAELALAGSERRFRSIFDYAPIGIVFVKASHILAVNPAFERLVGYTEEELRSMDWQSFTHPDDLPKELALVEELVQGKRTFYELEKRYIRKDGKIVWAKLTVSVFQDPHDDEVYGITTASDITAQKEAETALRNNLSLLQSLYNTIPIGICLTDEQGNFVEVNPAYCRTYGYTREELIGKHFTMVIPSEERLHAAGVHSAFIAGDIHSIGEWLLQRKDGSLRNIYVTGELLTLEDGRRYKVTAVEDITERKAQETALRDMQHMLAETEQLAHIGSWQYDVITGKITWSEEVFHIYERDFSKGEPTLEEFFKLVPAAELKRLETVFTRAIQEGIGYEEEVRIYTETGKEKWVKVIGKPRKDDQGKVIQIYGSTMDITAQKQAELEREQYYNQLLQSQKMESLGVLASGVAHEFNNILQGILGYATMLRRRFPEGTPEREKLTQIENNIHRAANIARQMLGFARQVKTNTTPVSLQTCISEVIQILAPTLDKRIKISVDAPEDIPMVEGDKGQLEQALLNLAVNARDAIMPLLNEGRSRAEISFELRYEPIPARFQPQHGAGISKKFVHVTLRDDGAGIPEEIRSKIFDPFFTTKESGKGTGLGLSMVYGIVKNHNGYISFESEVGKGTAFHLFFPAVKHTHSSESVSASVRHFPGGYAGKILIIEDEARIREFLSAELQEHGYAVYTASNGLEGIALFEATKGAFDVVVLDINMPEMSGLDVFRRIKAIRPDAKVIVTTGYLQPHLSEEFLALGVSHILQKPYELVDLLLAIDEALTQK
ncbi:MAG: PAS domain S-box protein [Candidatus Thermochlorobacter sp.]